jgi:hypothetical protein
MHNRKTFKLLIAVNRTIFSDMSTSEAFSNKKFWKMDLLPSSLSSDSD